MCRLKVHDDIDIKSAGAKNEQYASGRLVITNAKTYVMRDTPGEV